MSNTTKIALASSFAELLEEKPFDDITIRDITENAGVNRQTFYYHFHDIYELMEWIIKTGVQDQVHSNNWKEELVIVFDYLKAHKKIFMNLYNSIKRDTVEDYLKNFISPGIHYYLYNMCEPRKLKEEDLQFVEHFLVVASVAYLLDWIKGGMKNDPNGIIDDLDRIILQSFRQVVTGTITIKDKVSA